MKRYRKTVSVLISVLCLVPAAGAAARAQSLDGGDFNLVSVPDEIKLGREMSAEVEREHPLLPDREVRRYVADLGGRLARYARNDSGIPLTFRVVRDDEVNAYTIPGGCIYINSGLIVRLGSESELAGVIAHEITHAVRRDGTRQLTRMYGMSLVLSLVLGGDAPQWQQIAGDLFSTVGLLAYGRSAEYEADRGAVRLSRAAGFNPRGYLDFLDMLQQMQRSQPSLLTELFSTHPDTAGRIEVVRAEIAAMPGPTDRLVTDTPQFDRIKRRIH